MLRNLKDQILRRGIKYSYYINFLRVNEVKGQIIIRLGPFIIKVRILKVIYRLNLLEKIKIYPIQYIIILELVYGNIKLLVYKVDMYRG